MLGSLLAATVFVGCGGDSASVPAPAAGQSQGWVAATQVEQALACTQDDRVEVPNGHVLRCRSSSWLYVFHSVRAGEDWVNLKKSSERDYGLVQGPYWSVLTKDPDVAAEVVALGGTVVLDIP
jgi:hypothetical protein